METRHSSDWRLRCVSSDWPAKAGSEKRESSERVGPVVGKGEDEAAETVDVPGRSVEAGNWVVPSLETMLRRLFWVGERISERAQGEERG